MNEFTGRIRWIEAEKGGRKRIPDCSNEKYAPHLRLPDSQIWSIIITSINSIDNLHVRFHFLADEGPIHQIKSGETYTICEGPHEVAYITVD